MKKNSIKIISLMILIVLVLSVNVFAFDVGVNSYPIETEPVSNSGTLKFTGSDGDGIPHLYNVEVSYDGKVDFNPNTEEDKVYSHHMYALGYTGNFDPSMELIQLVVYENGIVDGRTTSFSYCDRDHIWPGDQKLYFDEKSSNSFTVEHGSGRLQVVVLIYEYDVSFFSPTGSLNVYF